MPTDTPAPRVPEGPTMPDEKVVPRHAMWEALKAERARCAALQGWKDAIIEAHIINFTLTAEHENDPEKALADLISWEVKVALDPQVSMDAQALIAQGKQTAESRLAAAEEENRRLREQVSAIEHDANRVSDNYVKAEARLTALESALRRYGKHDPRCSYYLDEEAGCNCGFEAALQSAPRAQEAEHP